MTDIPSVSDALINAEAEQPRLIVMTHAHYAVHVARRDARSIWGERHVPFDPPFPDAPDWDDFEGRGR